MAYSYTEKKRIRKDFGKLRPVWMYLIYWLFRLIHTNSLPRPIPRGGSIDMGLHAAFKSVFPSSVIPEALHLSM